ncbi:MAG: hypothetical protein PVG24_14240 [Gammaproteobacteria bacterium]
MNLMTIAAAFAFAVCAIAVAIRAKAFARPVLAYGISAVLAVIGAALTFQLLHGAPERSDPVSAALSAGYLDFESRPSAADASEVRTSTQRLPSVPAMVEQLEARLNAEPADAKGWSLLAKSYAYIGNESGAETAISKAVLLGVEENTLRSQVAAVRGGR